MQVYDLAWSPTGEYILAGSTDNVARVFTACDGKCIKEIVEHNHYVQGVSWDPMNEYIATQSSDRSMHVHKIISRGPGQLEIHAIGKNTRIQHQHNHTPRKQRIRHFRRESTAASDAESSTSEITKDDVPLSHSQQPMTPSTPASTSSIPMPPPPMEASSRRSSFSNPPGSPAIHTRPARSPSPMPALPAIRAVPSAPSWATVKLYGDENFTNFFRRLTFSPDGGLLLTPAGQFEDPSVIPGLTDPTTKGKKRNNAPGSTSSVYIYTRANFARPPIAQLPGHKKASVGVRFSPILYELRQGFLGFEEPQSIVLEHGKEESVHLDLGEHNATASIHPTSPHRHSIPTPSLSPIVAPTPIFSGGPSTLSTPSPALRAVDARRSPTPGRSVTGTPTSATVGTSSVFALPYRMLYAVVTMDTVTIYDTQQAGPICLMTKLHYDEFTDITWYTENIFYSLINLTALYRSPDGQCLILSSRDGYCTAVVFDEILATHHTQQHTLQIQSIANHHSVPLTYSNSTPAPTPGSTPSIPSAGLPPLPPQLVTSTSTGLKRRADSPPPLLTPASSVDNENLGIRSSVGTDITGTSQQAPVPVTVEESEKERPKKKRRAALTKVADLG